MGTLQRNIKRKTPEIVEYWRSRIDEMDLGVDWCDAHTRCWRCGYKSSLDRCHIIPRSLGGLDESSNLVLLCKACHREAPNCSDPSYMWDWIRRTSVSMYDTYWTLKMFQEFKDMYGRNPFELPEFEDINIDLVNSELKKKMMKVIVHYGERGFNNTTMVWVLKECEDELLTNINQTVV